MPTETWEAWIEDWQGLVKEFGRKRFEEAVRKCWTELLFFPKPAEIRDRVPPYLEKTAEVTKELDELRRRKDSGERFYGLADLAKEFNQLVKAKEPQ